MQSDSGPVRPAVVELDDPGVFDRIVEAFRDVWVVWIGHQQTAAAGNGAGELTVIATRFRRVVGDGRDRCVETRCLGIPRGLLDREPGSTRNHQGIYLDLGA